MFADWEWKRAKGYPWLTESLIYLARNEESQLHQSCTHNYLILWNSSLKWGDRACMTTKQQTKHALRHDIPEISKNSFFNFRNEIGPWCYWKKSLIQSDLLFPKKARTLRVSEPMTTLLSSNKMKIRYLGSGFIVTLKRIVDLYVSLPLGKYSLHLRGSLEEKKAITAWLTSRMSYSVYLSWN